VPNLALDDPADRRWLEAALVRLFLRNCIPIARLVAIFKSKRHRRLRDLARKPV